mmetsp:Transcript_8693/g.11009  ORF Transcript_8693/g.11009 Transcript_8693/m.11009 type:complete len:370 (+) Transcript_8693:38-1147(+)
MFVVTFNSDAIEPVVMGHILDHCYTGCVSFPLGERDAVAASAQLIGLPELAAACANASAGDNFLNPSLQTYVLERAASTARRLLLKKPYPLHDVMVTSSPSSSPYALASTEGGDRYEYDSSARATTQKDRDTEEDDAVDKTTTEHPSHSCLLAAASPVLRSMLFSDAGGVFSSDRLQEEWSPESQTQTLCLSELSGGALGAILEYTYTRQAPQIEAHGGRDAMEILAASDRFAMPRLQSLVEIFISKALDKAIAVSIKDADCDIIGLLISARQCGAHQLGNFLRHFVATNYLVLIEDEESDGENLRRLEEQAPEDVDYIQKHRWPPLSYLSAVEEYNENKRSKMSKSKCSATATDQAKSHYSWLKRLAW